MDIYFATGVMPICREVMSECSAAITAAAVVVVSRAVRVTARTRTPQHYRLMTPGSQRGSWTVGIFVTGGQASRFHEKREAQGRVSFTVFAGRKFRLWPQVLAC